uniref:Na(+)/H(+) exchange regulatory cofactor NHE-RF n=1 Tax=Fundulus heteroclitus TaxID=8078 RepID=A0A3Q2P816_FUNHE
MENDLKPRLCFLIKGQRGYGFHLQGETKKKGGHFIRTVEPGSPADLAGLRAGDRLVEVNGENVEKETHHQVVSRICEVSHRTRLLVVDRETDDYLRSQDLACTEDQAVEMGNLSPRPSPSPTPSASPIPRENSPLCLKSNLRYFFHFPAADPPAHLAAQDKAKRASTASSSGTDTERLPRLCRLVKAENGYCFNLQSDKKKGGQFVRSVDPDSPAERAGVRPGDRIVEVNGVNTKGLRHSEVVALIRSKGDEVSLLVVDQETDELFRRLGITPTTALTGIAFISTEVYVDERRAESAPPTPSPTTELSATDAPVISVTLTDSGVTNSSPKSRANGSSASQQKVLATRNKKRAPPMDWSRKQELFSNF